MRSTGRIVGVATATSFLVGLVTVAAVVLADESAETIRYSLLSVNGVLSLLFVGVMTALPVSLFAGVAGGLIAARVARRRPVWSSSTWVSRGAAWGATIGALGAVVMFALPAAASSTFAPLLAIMALVGGAAGSVVGAVVGAYCSRLLRVA